MLFQGKKPTNHLSLRLPFFLCFFFQAIVKHSKEKNPPLHPVSSLLRFGRHDGKAHNAEVREAFARLCNKLVPRMATECLRTDPPATATAAQTWVSRLHCFGLCVRHIPLVRAALKAPASCTAEDEPPQAMAERRAAWRAFLLVELLSRALKGVWRHTLNQARRRKGLQQQERGVDGDGREPFLHTITNQLLQLWFDADDDDDDDDDGAGAAAEAHDQASSSSSSSSSSSAASRAWWLSKEPVKALVATFGMGVLCPEEVAAPDLRVLLRPAGGLLALRQRLGSVGGPGGGPGSGLPLQLRPKIKHIYLFDWLEAYWKVEQSIRSTGQAQLALCTEAAELYEAAFLRFPGNGEVLNNWALALAEAARAQLAKGDLSASIALLQRADDIFQLALVKTPWTDKPACGNVLANWAMAYKTWAKCTQSTDLWQRCLSKIQASYKLDPTFHARCTLGWIMVELGSSLHEQDAAQAQAKYEQGCAWLEDMLHSAYKPEQQTLIYHDAGVG